MADEQQPQPGEVWGVPDRPETWRYYFSGCDCDVAQTGFLVASRNETPGTRIYPPPARDDEPITADWLDACGVEEWTRGSSIVVYRIGEIGIRFIDGDLDVIVLARQRPIKTRQDLRDLLRLMGAEPLKEPKE